MKKFVSIQDIEKIKVPEEIINLSLLLKLRFERLLLINSVATIRIEGKQTKLSNFIKLVYIPLFLLGRLILHMNLVRLKVLIVKSNKAFL